MLKIAMGIVLGFVLLFFLLFFVTGTVCVGALTYGGIKNQRCEALAEEMCAWQERGSRPSCEADRLIDCYRDTDGFADRVGRIRAWRTKFMNPYIAADSVNVRAGPSTEYEIVAGAVRGEKVRVVHRGDGTGWSKVRLPSGTVGWIRNDLLDWF